MLKSMRRTRWSRAFSAVMAVWLVVSLSEPSFLHSCLVHDGARGAHSSHAAAPHSGHHHSSADSESPTKNDRDHGHSCTCLGHCCGAAPIGLAAIPASLAIGESAALRDTGLPAYAYVAVAAEHILPFQNGPPALL
jgi:hypothetical protein